MSPCIWVSLTRAPLPETAVLKPQLLIRLTRGAQGSRHTQPHPTDQSLWNKGPWQRLPSVLGGPQCEPRRSATGAGSIPLLSPQAPTHPRKPSIPLAPGAGRLCTCKRPSPPGAPELRPRGFSAPALAARAQSPGPTAGSSPPCGHGHLHAGVC